MSGNPDESNYIHDQPTDTLNESSSAALSSSTSDDEDVEGRLSTDSKIFERIKELGRRHGPLKPIRQSYRPSVTSRRSSSVGSGLTDDTNRDEGEVDEEGDNSGYVDLNALQRILGNRLKERPLQKLAGSEEISSTSSESATASVTVSGNEMPSAEVHEEHEPPERTEAQKKEETVADDPSDATGSNGDHTASGGCQDNEELSTRSQVFETQGSLLITAAQSTLQAPNSERKSVGTIQVSETHGSISLVSTKSKTRPGGSEKVSSTSGNSESGGSNAWGTSRMIMLPPSAVRPTSSTSVKSKEGSQSRSKESVSSHILPKGNDIVAENRTSSRGASKGHSARMITSTPAADSHLSVSQQLGISAIARNHSSVSSIPSFVTGDTSSKEITTTSFSESVRTGSRSSVKKRLTFEGEEESRREETKQSSLTRTLNFDDIPGLDIEGNQTSDSTPTLPQIRAVSVQELADSTAAANNSTLRDESSNKAITADEQQGRRQPSESPPGEENMLGGTENRLSGNMAEYEEMVQDNILLPAVASESDKNDDDEVVAQSFLSKVSDGQISISSSTAEDIFMSKCMAAIAYAEKNNLVVGNATKESMIAENIPPARMLKMKSANMFPQVRLGASDRTSAEEAKARQVAADKNRASHARSEDSINSPTSDNRHGLSKRFKRPRKLTGGSFLKKPPSEIYGAVLNYVHKTSMSSSQGSRMGQSSLSQRDNTQPKDVLPSIEEPDDEFGSFTQSQPSQPPDRARMLPELLPELLPAGRDTSRAASQVAEGSTIHSGSNHMEHVSVSGSKHGRQLAGPETSQLAKGSMESLFSEGKNARTPRRSGHQKKSAQRLQEPVIERRSDLKNSRSTEGSKGPDRSTIHNVTSRDRVSGSDSKKSSASPVLQSQGSSNIARNGEEPSSNACRTAEGAGQETVRFLTPRRNSTTHSHFLLGSSPSLSRRPLHPAPSEDSADDESSFVRQTGERQETRTKSAVDKHRLHQVLEERRQCRIPVVDSSSSEAELEQRQKGRPRVDERRKRQSAHHGEASVTRPPSSFSHREDVEATCTLGRTKRTSSSSRDKFEETRGELNVESRIHARGTPEPSGGDDLPEPAPHSNTFVVPAIVEPNPISPSSHASRLESSSRESEAENSDATITMSSFLESKKQKKLSNNSSTADKREVLTAAVTQIEEKDGMEIGMLSPRDQVEISDRVVAHVEDQDEEEPIEVETQGGSSKSYGSVAGGQAKKSTPSVKDRLSVKQTNTRSSHISPTQLSRREPVTLSPASPYNMRSRNNVSRPSLSISSIRSDPVEEMGEAPQLDQSDVEELPAEQVLSQTLKRKPSRHGQSLSNSEYVDPGRLQEDSDQDRGGLSAKTFMKPRTSLNTRSMNNKSQPQIIEEVFDEVLDEILDEEEDIENDEPVHQTRPTFVTSGLEDSVRKSDRPENSATAETRGQPESHDSQSVRSLRRSSRKSSVASSAVPLTEHRATPEGEDTRIEGGRKRRGEAMDTPERVAVEEAEEPEEPVQTSSRQTGSRRVTPAQVATSKVPKKIRRTAAAPTLAAAKKPKKNNLEALMQNDNLISTQLVRWKCEANNIRLNNTEIAEMTSFLNEKFKEMLDSLQRSTLRENGMFSFRELEGALKSLGLIYGERNELLCWFAQLLTPEDYKKAQGVLIPKGRDRDT